MEPEGSFERTVVCEDDSSVILSEDTLSRIRATLARLEEKQEANRKRAEMYRDRIEAIIAKLNKGQVCGELETVSDSFLSKKCGGFV